MNKRLPPSNAKYHKGYPKTSTSDQSFVTGLDSDGLYREFCVMCGGRGSKPDGRSERMMRQAKCKQCAGRGFVKIPQQAMRRIGELERLLRESQGREAEAAGTIGDIEQIRSVEGNSVTILSDNPEAEEVDKQAAVDASGDFTGWEEVRYHGRAWVEALAKAAHASRSSYPSEDQED